MSALESSATDRAMAFFNANTAVAVASLWVIGFAVGATTLGAYAAGLNVAPSDLGVDYRQILTLAGATLLPPIVAVGCLSVPVWPSRLWRSVTDAVAFVTVFVFSTWWFWGVADLRFFAAGALGIGLVEMVFHVTSRGSHGPSETESSVWRRQAKRSVVIALLVVGFVALPVSAWWHGKRVQDDARAITGPPILDFVVRPQRGLLTVGNQSVCVDRIGSDVVLGSDVIGVVRGWESFVRIGCARGELQAFLRPPHGTASQGDPLDN